MTIYTIGHSTRTLDDFLALLRAHAVTRLADVRTVPKSRRHPHFAGDALSRSLPDAGVAYRHFPGLGGLRKPRPDSRNTAWRHASFRGYADHMQTAEFQEALNRLIEAGRSERVVIMCAEAVPWRCHRSLISDALTVRGVPVEHVMSAAKSQGHTIIAFARVRDGSITYPKESLDFD